MSPCYHAADSEWESIDTIPQQGPRWLTKSLDADTEGVSVTQEELLAAYQREDRDDYGKHYLLPFWEEHAGKNTCNSLLGGHFADAHIGRSIHSTNAAVDVGRRRFGGANATRTSTQMPEKAVQQITKYLQTYAIKWHVQSGLQFRNYLISDPVKASITLVDPTRGTKASMDNIHPIIGINERGLINHFHGDEEYHGGAVFVMKGNGNWGKEERV